jgi:anti-sigma B factor antagonist
MGRGPGIPREPAYSVELYPRPPLQVRIATHRTHIRLTVAGDIDLLSADEFDSALDSVIADVDRHLWIDLSEVDFLGSPAIHSLLRARRKVVAGRHVIVICPTGGPLRVLELVGLQATIPIFPDAGSVPRAYR